jgi:hypothetical protein
MTYRLRKSTWWKSQTDLQHQTTSPLEGIGDNNKTSAKDNLGYHKLKHKKPQFDDGCSNLIDQKNKLNYNGCKIQAKSVVIICKI